MYMKIIQRMRMVVGLAVAAPWRRFAWRAILAIGWGGLVATAQADYYDAVTNLNPLAYWRLNETAITVDPNIATNNGTGGSSLNGTYQNSGTRGVTGALVGDSDTAVSFSSGSSQAMSVPYSSALNPSGDFTYEIWAYPTVSDGSARAVCSSGNFFTSGNRQGFIIYNLSSNWSFRLYTGSSTSFTELLVPLDLNAWQHLALVRSGTTISAYKNGVFQTSTTNAMNAPTAGSYTAVGARWIGDASGFLNYFDGKADEFAIYNIALSAGDLLAHYDNGTNSARSTPYQTLVGNSSPVGYYRLNEPAFAFPTAVNSGSLGSAADGTYSAGTFTAQAGPPFSGLGTSNVACWFDSSGQIACGNNTNFDVTNISIAAWIKPGDVYLNMTVIGKGNSLWRLQMDNATSHLTWVCPGVTDTGTKNVIDGVWHHVVAVAGTNGSALYVDGVLDASNSTPVTLSADTNVVTIGSATDVSARWYGSLDEVALFGTALTYQDVTNLYLAASPPTKDIYSFGPGAVITGTNIAWTLPVGTAVTHLAPTFAYSFQATPDKASGSTQDFSGPVTYTITAPDVSTKTYRVTVTISNAPVLYRMACWYDAGVGVATNGSGVITNWNDQSGHAHTATLLSGAPTLATNDINARPGVHYRTTSCIMDCAGQFFTKEQYVVVRSPNNNWVGNGSFLGRASPVFLSVRESSYNLANGTTGFWQDHYPVTVSKNGIPPSNTPPTTVLNWASHDNQGNFVNGCNFAIDTITNYMILKITVDDTAAKPWASKYQIGQNETLNSAEMDIAEIIGYSTALSSNDEAVVGAYLAAKYGLSTAYPQLGPTMSFTATPTNGYASLAVTFTDTSTPNLGAITNRYWTFGDGGTTNIVGTNVTYTYSSTGTFTVALTDYDNAGASSGITRSNLIVVTTLPAPSNLTAQALSARVNLSWSPVSGAAGYLLSRANASNAAPDATFPTAATAYLDTGVTNGTEYWYTVAATNSAGPGGNSAWVPATPQAPTPPAFLPGSGVSVNAGTGAATLTFTTSDGWQYQIVYKNDLLSGVWTAVPPGWQTASSNGTMTVTDPNATNSPQRFYRVEIR